MGCNERPAFRRPAFRRVAAFGIVCAGALFLASAPASALTLAVGGSGTGATISVGDGPIAVNVEAPSTAITVDAAPSGLQATVKTPVTPPLNVAVNTPAVAGQLPITPTQPVGAPVNPPSAATPMPRPVATPAPAPVVSRPGPSTNTAKPAHIAIDTSRNAASATAPAMRAINAMRHDAAQRAHAPKVTGAIASGSGTGALSSFRSIDARLILWMALAGLVLAIRLFAGSATSKAARAS